MRKYLAVALLLYAALPTPTLRAAINTYALLRVFPTIGAATNGGGFDPSVTSPGTDYSVNVNANAAGCTSCGSSTVDLSTTDAVANGTTTITSAAGAFSTLLPGNIIRFNGGTGTITAQRRTVISRTNSTTIVIDQSIAASTGMTMRIGGALDTIATALLDNTVGMLICVKATGTITETASLTLNNSTGGGNFNRLWAYTTTCGDHGPVNMTLSTNTGLTAIDGSGAAGWWIDGFNIDCANLGTSKGIVFAAQSQLTHTKIANCTSRLFNTGGSYANVLYNEFTGCTAACSSAVNLGNGSVVFKFNNVHHDATIAITSGSFNILTDNLIWNITGGINSDGIDIDLNNVIERNVFYSITGSCVLDNGSSGHIYLGTTIQNNIFDGCARYGILGSGAAIYPSPNVDGNAYFNSGLGNRNGLDNTTFANYYVNVYDIQLSVDPFTNAAGGAFTLNGTAGGGAALKATGQAGFAGPTWNKATGVGYMDLGAFQTQYGTGGAGGGNSGYVQ